MTGALPALIMGQIGLHACMAGVRMAAPLQALRLGFPAWAVGVLLALFAVSPVLLALKAGRMADRHGYHRPMRVAVTLTAGGGLLAVLSALWGGPQQFGLLCVAASLAGGGAHFGLIAIQRTASRNARDSTERKQIFSWLGLAPALSNLLGPVLAGLSIDAGGFALAYGVLAALPLVSLACARRVPIERPPPVDTGTPPPSAEDAARAVRPGAWGLLTAPGMPRLLLVNWLLSASWDLHSFVLPVLGHERGYSASSIGAVLGVFAAAVAAVRLVVPLVARRAREPVVLVAAMWCTAASFLLYPLMPNVIAMGGCAALLGAALGVVNPMVMSLLHHLTPDDRHGEAIALRSMTINASSAAMPLMFGVVGAAFGAAPLFWVMGGAVATGSWAARRVGS